MAQSGAAISNIEMALFELQRVAEGPEFKGIGRFGQVTGCALRFWRLLDLKFFSRRTPGCRLGLNDANFTAQFFSVEIIEFGWQEFQKLLLTFST